MKGECDLCGRMVETKRKNMDINGRINICKDCLRKNKAFINFNDQW